MSRPPVFVPKPSGAYVNWPAVSGWATVALLGIGFGVYLLFFGGDGGGGNVTAPVPTSTPTPTPEPNRTPPVAIYDTGPGTPRVHVICDTAGWRIYIPEGHPEATRVVKDDVHCPPQR